MATVRPAPPVAGNLYADSRSARANPSGTAVRAGAASAKHRAYPGRDVRHTGLTPAGTVPGAGGVGRIAIPSGALTSAAWWTVSSSVLPAASAACNRTARYPDFMPD